MTGRGRSLAFAAVLAACAAAPAGAEGPPPGFSGAQYVDAQGCVFARSAEGWAPRRNRDGSPVCGYPAAVDATEATAAAAPTSPPPAPPETVPAATAAPTAAVTEAGIEAGTEAAATPAPPAALPVTPDEPLAPARRPAPTLAAPVEQPSRPPVLNDLPPPRTSARPPAGPANGPACALIALSADGRIAAGPGRGYDTPEPPRACTAPLPDSFAAAPEAPVAATAAPRRIAPQKPLGQTARRTPPHPQKTRTAPQAAGGPAPGHRYVQVGSYGDPANGARALSRILGMGLPAARGKGRIGGQAVQVIYAGPFDDAAALRAALVRLRAVGYADAFTR